MSNPEQPPQRRRNVIYGSILGRRCYGEVPILAGTILGLAGALGPAIGAEKTEELYFAGKLIELDAAKHTFTIRSRNKELVFTINPARCDITVNGSVSERACDGHEWRRSHGRAIAERSEPYVTWVEFTHHPETGKPVAGKPGYSFLLIRDGPDLGIVRSQRTRVDSRMAT